MKQSNEFKVFTERLDDFVDFSRNLAQDMLLMLGDIETRYDFAFCPNDGYLLRGLKGMFFDFRELIKSHDDDLARLEKALDEFRPEKTAWFEEYAVPGLYEACTVLQLVLLDAVGRGSNITSKLFIAHYHQYYNEVKDVMFFVELQKRMGEFECNKGRQS